MYVSLLVSLAHNNGKILAVAKVRLFFLFHNEIKHFLMLKSIKRVQEVVGVCLKWVNVVVNVEVFSNR